MAILLNNGMPISSGDAVCVLLTCVIVGCTTLPRYSVHQGSIHTGYVSSICKCSFLTGLNISGFEDCCEIAANQIKSNQINFIYTPQLSKTIQGCLQCNKSIDVKIKFRKYNYSHH